MKKLFLTLALVFIAAIVFSCGGSSTGNDSVTPAPGSGQGNSTSTEKVQVTTPENRQGHLYIDGVYSGTTAPSTVNLTKGKHVIGVAIDGIWVYLRKEIEVTGPVTVDLKMSDAPTRKIWKALWVGLEKANGTICYTNFSNAELNTGYDFFRWSIEQHFQTYTYQTINWDITRKDVPEDFVLTVNSFGYVVDEAKMFDYLKIKPGDYDCVFVAWRGKDGTCDLSSGNRYFGLAGTDPMSNSKKTGFVTVRFNADNGLENQINNLKANDPGVYIHEWLHTTGEVFYANRGSKLPDASLGNGFRVHAAEGYGYRAPWMDWYKDFVSARVVGKNQSGYLGIGPEMFLKCTLRELAEGTCKD